MPSLIALVIFLAILVTSGAITYTLKALDHDSIVSLRRTFGLILASNLLWAIALGAGSLLRWMERNQQPSLNGFVFGAFLAWSFDLLVINGAFVYSTAKSLCLAATHPAVILFLAWTFVTRSADFSLLYAAALGLVVLVITTTFLLKFKTFKTSGAGINSLQAFQSFLKTWVSQKPANLENYFTMYSHDESVTTQIVLLKGRTSSAAVVLPGVHPGPFFPVGSYNVSELIFHEFRKGNVVPMVLHGIGGHERNLPTNELARQYAAAVASAPQSSGIDGQRVEKMRGPCRFRVGPTSITALGFGNHIIAFLSSAPYNTDDLSLTMIDHALSAAKELGLDLMLVDAHNSIGGENCEQPDVDWKTVLSDVTASTEEEFEVSVAHSSELNFEHGSDISDGGMAVLVFRKKGGLSTCALVTSDSNNAAVGLRQTVFDELKKENVDVIEICTSDTHNSAARSLINRGYHALGEDTSPDLLIATIKKLESMAEAKLARGEAVTLASQLTLPLIGGKPLNDFADLTKETLSFARVYARAAIPSILITLSLALLL